MSSLAQAPATREQLTTLIAELYGDTPATLSTADARWADAIAQVGEHLRAKLRVEVLPERLRKALELVQASAITLHTDGTASVQSGKQTYALAPDCPCADAKHRTELCKHALAVELHRRALAVFHGEAPASAPATPSQAAAVAALPSAPASHAWDVHEAPASACFKFRVGTMELMYTLRGVDDQELQRRMTATLPTLQDIIEACEARAAQRLAEREAAQAPAVPPPVSAPADLQALLQQALQHALGAQAANGQAPSTPPSHGQRQAKAKVGDQATGFCSLHNVAMEHRENERGSWYSHWLPEDERHCKGRR